MVEQASALLAGLNPSQAEAVVSTEGPVLVVAGPGSGKTRVLTHRIAYLMEERNVLPDQIMAVTFTNKAAREMRSRVEKLLSGRAAAGLVMGTFHSLGVRFLRQNPGAVADRLGLLPNFLIYDDSDQLAVAKAAIVAAGQDPKQLAPRRALSRVSAAKSALLSPQEAQAEAATFDDEVIARVYAQYQAALRKANAVDFDDLLALPIRLFDEAPGVLAKYQERYRYILVDEYQDTNRVQYVLVSALSAHWRNLFVVGDPDQSIYGWRQADIRNILDFERDYPDAKRIDLELNYRSTARIVAVADRVIRENTQRLDRKLRTENPEGAPVVLHELSDQNHEATFVVSEIRRLTRNGGYEGDDIAVMYRTTAQSRVLEEAFRNSDIPYRIVGGVRFYDRKEVKDILAVLRLLHNPADDVSLERIIDNHPLGRGIGPKAVDAVRAWATEHGVPTVDGFLALVPPLAPDLNASAAGEPPLSGSARTAGQRLGAAFARLREAKGSSTLAALFDEVVEQTGYRSAFDEESEEALQRWANVLELRADLERYDIVDPSEALATYLEQVALVSDVDALAEDGRTQVTLITLHSAKGLEFPVVFITGVEEGLLPISRAVEAEFHDPLPLEEERRLFYVGITRAEKSLYLTYAASRQVYGRYQPGVASRFLASIPQDALQTLTRSFGGRPSASRLADRVRGDGGHQGGGNGGWASPMPERAPAAQAEPLPNFRVGQRVFHAKFGEGRVAEVVERTDDKEVAVDFARHGKKRLMASFARLDIIAES
jgi:DNA helicase-2/ATP-dependent DNA helicase PcrA